MNKKVLTLCVSALLAGGMVGTANAFPANSTQIETRAVVSDALTTTATLPTSVSNVGATVLPQFTNNSRLFLVTESSGNVTVDQFVTVSSGALSVRSYTSGDNEAYWTMSGNDLINNANHAFTAGAYSKFDIVPVTTATDDLGCFFVLRAKNTDGSAAGYVTYSSTFGVTTGIADTDLASAALFVSVETAYSATAMQGSTLNAQLDGGFGLTISSAKDDVISISGADVFGGTLTAMGDASKVQTDASSYDNYYLRTEDGQFIYWDETTNDDSDEPGSFTLKSKDDFQAAINGGTTENYLFHIYAADNGSDAVRVTVGRTTEKRLYINNTLSTGRLTAVSEVTATTVNVQNWAVTTLGASNSVDLRSMLQGKFLKISFAGTGTGANDAYKVGGVLAIRDNKADFVDADGLYENAPEAHWAATYDATTGLTLANRENPNTTLVISGLRTDDDAIYAVSSTAAEIAGDSIKIEFVNAPAISTDGYLDDYTETELRNTAFYLALHRDNADSDIPAYWAENHNASHQIGATVVKDNATKWNLAFKKKTAANHTSEIDTVYVTSTLQSWNASTNVITNSTSRLAILPYTFQNRSNQEFVKLNNQQNMYYYICDEDNNDATDNGNAQKFIIKMKADGTYNYVPLRHNDDGEYDYNTYNDKGLVTSDYVFVNTSTNTTSSKVFEGNSLQNGSWENMDMYASDYNSLMLVERVDAPEYHKVTLGDTITLHRFDNDAQVVYEHKDVNSVTEEGDTLSFLTIDNEYQFDFNPAMLAIRTNHTPADSCFQYLLVVEPVADTEWYCPYNDEHNTDAWREANGGHCADAVATRYVKGRFMVNMIDTANIYGANHLHDNPYINTDYAGEDRAKLAFVPGTLIGDTLYLPRQNNTDTVKLYMGSADFNVAKFAFRYVNADEVSFKIQTAYKDYTPNDPTYNATYSNEGYLKWINSTLVVEEGYNQGDVFGIVENVDANPTANESIEDAVNSAISVAATEGGVIVKGAEGKNVVVATILGKVVANETLNSDNVTISVPAGIAVVSVDGESFKVVVK